MLKPPIESIEAQLVARIPEGPDWQYEPKGMAFVACSFVNVMECFFSLRLDNPLPDTFQKSLARPKI
jgi:hypothetical protein